jgi:hypothetical protein
LKQYAYLLTLIICISSLSIKHTHAKLNKAIGHYGLVRSTTPIQHSHWRGHLGEQLIEHHYLKTRLKLSHRWVALTPIKGRQGIDLLYIKYDINGHPTQAWVGEVKYGSARLRITKKGGIQASQQWYQYHFKQLAEDYRTIAQRRVTPKRQRYAQQQFPVKSGTFWREKTGGIWHYSGSENTLKKAQQEAKNLSQFYNTCAKGQCSIQSRLYEVTNYKSNILLTVRDTHGLNYGQKQRELTVIDTYKIGKDQLGGSRKLRKTLYYTLRRTHPSLTIDQSNQIYNRELATHRSLAKSQKIPITNSLFMALSDLVLNAYSLCSVAERNMGQAVGSIAVGISIEIAAHYLINEALNLTQVSLFSELLGGAMGAILFASLDWFSHGQIDPASIAQGMSFTLGSALSSYGAFTLAASYGIAGSGASIGTLSGAAATKATLAWLGGGTLASGGGGMMAGSIILSGLTIGIGTFMAFGTKMAIDVWEAKDRLTFQVAILNDVIKMTP